MRNNILTKIDDIHTALGKLLDDICGYYDDENSCQLREQGICPAIMGEWYDCYYYVEDCIIKKAGLYRCGEVGEVVDRETCEACNDEQECGCCEYVQNGTAPYNCSVCGKKQIVIEGVGRICVEPDTSPEEIERIKREAKENPGAFFSCI